MRFSSLAIRNFKAIDKFEVEQLTDFVMIAGPNGCGKSCVFDAIRLLKSLYGGPQANEWTQWFGEFQIRYDDRRQLRRLFRDRSKPIEMQATIELSSDEKQHLHISAEQLVEPLVWRSLTGSQVEGMDLSSAAYATQYREYGDEAKRQIAAGAADLRKSLESTGMHLGLVIPPDQPISVVANRTMEIVFQTYDPSRLGLIEYHSASRTYQREAIGGINLNLKSAEEQAKNSSLYNWQQKYQNIKSELAATYVRELIARQNSEVAPSNDLNATLRFSHQEWGRVTCVTGVTWEVGVS